MRYGPIGFRPPNPWGMAPAQGPYGLAEPARPAQAAPMQAGTAGPMGGGQPCVGSQDLEFLRQDLRGELEAINQYWYHIANAKDQRVKDLLCEIMNDEKHHYAEVTKLIRALDPAEDYYFRLVAGEQS